MGHLLAGMQEDRARREVALSMSKSHTLAEVLKLDSLLETGSAFFDEE